MKDKFKGNKNEDDREPGQPHLDAQRNLKTTLDYIKNNPHLPKKYNIVFEQVKNVDGQKVIENPILIRFDWKDHVGRQYANPLSFHQDSYKFWDLLKGFK